MTRCSSPFHTNARHLRRFLVDCRRRVSRDRLKTAPDETAGGSSALRHRAGLAHRCEGNGRGHARGDCDKAFRRMGRRSRAQDPRLCCTSATPDSGLRACDAHLCSLGDCFRSLRFRPTLLQPCARPWSTSRPRNRRPTVSISRDRTRSAWSCAWRGSRLRSGVSGGLLQT